MNNIIHKYKKSTLTILLSILSVGCGGGSDSPNTSEPSANEPRDARVTVIKVEKATFSVGDSSLVSVDVTYAVSKVEENGERVALVLKLPVGLTYAIDSSGIRTSTSSANTVPVKTSCADGSSFLAYELGAIELNDSQDPDGIEDADFELIFVADGVSPTGITVITAGAADNSLSYSCDGGYKEEASVGLNVN